MARICPYLPETRCVSRKRYDRLAELHRLEVTPWGLWQPLMDELTLKLSIRIPPGVVRVDRDNTRRVRQPGQWLAPLGRRAVL